MEKQPRLCDCWEDQGWCSLESSPGGQGMLWFNQNNWKKGLLESVLQQTGFCGGENTGRAGQELGCSWCCVWAPLEGKSFWLGFQAFVMEQKSSESLLKHLCAVWSVSPANPRILELGKALQGHGVQPETSSPSLSPSRHGDSSQGRKLGNNWSLHIAVSSVTIQSFQGNSRVVWVGLSWWVGQA